MLQTGSAAVIFYALSTITAAVLQGSDHMNLPAVHAAAALAVHTVLVWVLLHRTSLGIYALIVGNVTFPLMLAALKDVYKRQPIPRSPASAKIIS